MFWTVDKLGSPLLYTKSNSEDQLVNPHEYVHVCLVLFLGLLLGMNLLAENTEKVLTVEISLNKEKFQLLQYLLGYVKITQEREISISVLFNPEQVLDCSRKVNMKLSWKDHSEHVHHDPHIKNILVLQKPDATIFEQGSDVLIHSIIYDFSLALTFVVGVLLLDQFFHSCDLFFEEVLRVYTRYEQELLVAFVVFLLTKLLFENIAIYRNHKLLGPKQQKLLFVYRERGNSVE